ncbi:extracellular GDSL-like lipase/acylhydrolase [Rhodofomes roseus]|uniref:Extracellular GDSL-like lipase/acylhydrolase n=1 Tax=Rhodofomes roseus TaxID=34475 RepID=A0ABQ8KX34_9APHY|nr:extracellular GDSL-like lipase/acylhydrolase [Rhodofomes roseus]KAH9843624.1 extracellular GDSL-like lipase/acylhydrolase [Rhodofomes roseus]
MPAGHWVDIWVTMPQLTEYYNVPNPPFNGTNSIFTNSTIRQTLHTSIPAESYIRIRISNAFGVNDFPSTQVAVALPLDGAAGSPQIVPGSSVPLTFSGNTSIIIPDGAQVVSDPIYYPLEAQSMVTVTLYTKAGQEGFYITSHPGSRTNTWYSLDNYVDALNLTDPSTQYEAHWFFLSAIEAWPPLTTSGWVIVGDSITDGRGSDTDENNRYNTFAFALPSDPFTAGIAVLNQAAGGNRILYDGLGPNALGRIERDVLAQSGIKDAMIFEGVNDIGTAATDVYSQQVVGNRLIQAFEQIVTRVHTFGIPIIAATITPFGAPNSTIQPYADSQREITRQRVNAWIRDSGRFDAVIDFDAIVRDPNNVTELNPAYNSGDYLHPNVAGYTAIADAFPIDLFERFAFGVHSFQ